MIIDWNNQQNFYGLGYIKTYDSWGYGALIRFYPFEMILTTTKNIAITACK